MKDSSFHHRSGHMSALGLFGSFIASIGAFLSGMNYWAKGDSEIWVVVAFGSSIMLALIGCYWLFKCLKLRSESL